MKIRPVGAELLHAETQTYRRTYRHDEAIVDFCNFAKTPKRAHLISQKMQQICFSFQASAAVWRISSLSWDITQRWMVVRYRRFGKV